MKRNSRTDYLACIVFRVFAPLIRALPLWAAIFFGSFIGEILYLFDRRHRFLARANLKKALDSFYRPAELDRITRQFYRSFGQSIIEIFLIPRVNKEYIKKYITIEGIENFRDAFKKGKGVILAPIHEGNWELANTICSGLDFPFVMFVRGDPKLPRLSELLNSYRAQKGTKVIKRGGELRELIAALKENKAMALTVDQGGRDGCVVDFFGHPASMSTGAIRLAIKYGAVLIPVFYTRLRGHYAKIFLEEPFEIKRGSNEGGEVRDNLQRLILIFEKYLKAYPKEYYWPYKIWKYSNQKNLLILSDQKAGHLRQAQAVANVCSEYLAKKNFKVKVDTLDVEFKSSSSGIKLHIASLLHGKYQCQGCLWCLRRYLKADCYQRLLRANPDVIISCGSKLSPVNYLLGRQGLGKSVVVMRPALLGTDIFDLVIMPRHDSPPLRYNIVETKGALNLIDQRYLAEKSSSLIEILGDKYKEGAGYIGLLIGGDAKNFTLTAKTVSTVCRQLKDACEKTGFGLLVTTSRRTSRQVEDLLKQEFRDYPSCSILVIANENNFPEAVGGILGLASIIVCSPESISMISEAASSAKYVLAFRENGLGARHKSFLETLSSGGHIHLTEADGLFSAIIRIEKEKPKINILDDKKAVREKMASII